MISPAVLGRIGDRTPADWLLSARTVSPAEAQAPGFITRAVTSNDVPVDETVEVVLADLHQGSLRALAASKTLVNRTVIEAMDAPGGEMMELSGTFFTGDDAQAGMKAFFDKTSPPWVVEEPIGTVGTVRPKRSRADRYWWTC